MKSINVIVVTCLVGLIFIAAGSVCAEVGQWGDEAELSYVDTSGNSEVTTLSAKNKLTYQFSEKITGLWKVEVLNGKSDGERNAESYFSELRGDYLSTERLFYYANASWGKDSFANVDSRIMFGAGSGYKALVGPEQFLQLEAGLTYTIEELTGDSNDEYVGGRLFGIYEYHFNEKSKFSQSLELLLDLEETRNYLINSETALITALNSVLSFKTSYVIAYDNEPADGTDDTDTVLGVSLVANF